MPAEERMQTGMRKKLMIYFTWPKLLCVMKHPVFVLSNPKLSVWSLCVPTLLVSCVEN